MKHPLLLLLLLSVTAITLQAQDTLWVKQENGHPYLVHHVEHGENLFLLSRRFSVPPAVLADQNHISYQDGLAEGSRFKVPVDRYNFVRIESVVKSRPIFYRALRDDDLRDISRMFNVSQSTIQRWNRMESPEVTPGETLQVGWIAYDPAQVPFPAAKTDTAITVAAPERQTGRGVPPDTAVTAISDTVKKTRYERLYEQQTMGRSVSEESGAAAFYPLRTKATAGVYYAFHNTAARGSILKITNPANGRTIYAKVIGSVPKLKTYHNCIVGLSNNAIPALGAKDMRMFCNLNYR